MNMFKESKVRTVTEYLATLPAERKEAVRAVHEIIRKTVPKLKVYFAGNMIGYGSFQYKNYKKEIIQWPVVALANQKQYISVYVCSIIDGRYVAERYKTELGKVKVGRSCISFKKLTDLHLPTLKRVLQLAARYPGLTP